MNIGFLIILNKRRKMNEKFIDSFIMRRRRWIISINNTNISARELKIKQENTAMPLFGFVYIFGDGIVNKNAHFSKRVSNRIRCRPPLCKRKRRT
jgi:hypothetical protein